MGQEFSIFSIISSAGIVVKIVLLILLVFSIASWTIIFLKIFMIRKANSETSKFVQLFWKCQNLSEAYSSTKIFRSSPAAKIFRLGYAELQRVDKLGSSGETSMLSGSKYLGISIKRKLKNGISEEMKRLVQTIPFLATVGNTAPFIGLFGTVWGIMDSFHNIGTSKSISLAVVAPGISEALVATAFGLLVAIPSVIAFNFFSNRLESLNTTLESFSSDFLNIIEYEIFRAGS
ncbi:MAG: protein TolQ [Deltaproteobacteria bacterium]|nr:MAG: protein TolQ [Deltaproteobacteria bacterium]